MATYDSGEGVPREPGFFEGMPRWAILSIRAGAIIVAIFVAYALLARLRTAYTNWLWFDNVGFRTVYSTGLFTQVVLYAIGFVTSAVAVFFSYRWAWRTSWGPTALPFSAFATAWIKRSLIIGAIIMGTIVVFSFAAGLSDRWLNFLEFWNSTSFGMSDPQFGHDVGFYVFTLPMLQTLQGWVLGLSIVVLITTGGLYLLVYSARGINPVITTRAKQQFAVAGAVLMVSIAAGHFLDTFETLFSPDGAVTGATYADVHARIPALYLLTAVALLAAGIMLAALRVSSLRESMRMIIAAFVLWAAAGLLAGVAWPYLVQRLSVEPSEFLREEPYIARNIKWTRMGYNLDNVQVSPFQVKSNTLAQDIANNQQTINNIRLWGPRTLKSVLNQIQHLSLYYSFLDVDIDRYTVNGKYTEILTGTRELSQSGLDPSAQNWINRTLVYTHGYGVVMAKASTATPAGEPDFIEKDVPIVGDFNITQPRIYYGESFGLDTGIANGSGTLTGQSVSNDVAVVNTNEKQVDRPASNSSDTGGLPVFVDSYDGSGGVPLTSFFRRVMYAWQFGDLNFLFSHEFTPDSKVLYRRNIAQRVHTVAPWLELDSDPYMVVSDGKLYWIQDAYVTTDRFPYSKTIQTVLSSGDNAQTRTRFNQPLNYIRNSVKVVINAYDGSMKFYTIENNAPDPVLDMWRNTFPDLFTPIDQMPAGLRAHIRYPQALLQAQADIYLQYHMTDPREFFLKEDQWQLGREVIGSTVNPSSNSSSTTTTTNPLTGQSSTTTSPTEKTRVVDPYYIIMRLPGQQQEEFVLILPFTPKDKQNLVAWMAARSDGAHYGEISVYEFPRDQIFDGPQQVEARIDNDPAISQQFTLWDQSGSRVVRGNLLVIPIGNSLLYAEPIYLQAEQLEFPELKRVILASDTDVVMAPTLDAAVQLLLSGQHTTGTGGNVTGGVDPNAILNIVDQLKNALQSLSDNSNSLNQLIQSLQDLAQGAQGANP